MTNNQLTREENVQAVFDLKAGYTLGLADVEILKRVARMALAAMDSESVAVPDHLTYLQNPTLENVLSDDEENSPMAHAARILAREVKFWRSAPLYLHAQQPVVPEDVLDALQKVARIRLDLNEFDGDRRGIADCLGDAEEALIEVVNRRAAMLQAGNSPVIPDGYVMVPKEPTSEMQSAGASAIRIETTAVNKLWTGNAVYRAMLAAVPQEVKS
ncbi:hypothetical protein [Klebsiella quasivariicola]|uniref:hypothetical protein n=1 Tax=Klebsiella quasivariicola TaxID=2026240 RepID=UPI000BA1E503|nr:hypothetical protein [Klebsiella quasivariicola]ASV21257.1 hypothetical protein B8P98_19140 [Klebsiella quasivariicola]